MDPSFFDYSTAFYYDPSFYNEMEYQQWGYGPGWGWGWGGNEVNEGGGGWRTREGEERSYIPNQPSQNHHLLLPNNVSPPPGTSVPLPRNRNPSGPTPSTRSDLGATPAPARFPHDSHPEAVVEASSNARDDTTTSPLTPTQLQPSIHPVTNNTKSSAPKSKPQLTTWSTSDLSFFSRHLEELRIYQGGMNLREYVKTYVEEDFPGKPSSQVYLQFWKMRERENKERIGQGEGEGEGEVKKEQEVGEKRKLE
ncbi:hypothetical protein BDY24DRAFT_185482 [Mrakia frigida]|uniref:uncharacterized protein n=1 Tax=Mrakia frigida TaxID=29902 RepID=UPI003FCBFDED